MLRAFARFLLRICFSRRTLKIACLLLLVAGATIFIADRVMVNASKQLTRAMSTQFRRVTWAYCWGRAG